METQAFGDGLRIARENDSERLYAFSWERWEKLSQSLKHPPEQTTLTAWRAPWRKEALDFYLKTGWCFLKEEVSNKKILSYIMVQPFVFFRTTTQTLWLEWIEGEEPGGDLTRVLVGIAKEKHFQCIFMPKELSYFFPEKISQIHGPFAQIALDNHSESGDLDIFFSTSVSS